MNVKEIRDKSNEELNKEMTSLKEELFNLRFQQATGQLENPARMKDIKKTIARIKTIITITTTINSRTGILLPPDFKFLFLLEYITQPI